MRISSSTDITEYGPCRYRIANFQIGSVSIEVGVVIDSSSSADY